MPEWIIRGNNLNRYNNLYAVITEDEVEWIGDRSLATRWPSEQEAMQVRGLIRSRKKRLTVEEY